MWFCVCCLDGKYLGCDVIIMSRREFFFILEYDIYICYLLFYDVVEMEVMIKSKCFYKIDIGVLYNVEVGILFVNCLNFLYFLNGV